MNADTSSPIPGGEVIVYESPDGEGRVDVRLEDESVWLTQRQMAEVFQSTPQNVLMHLRNVFSCKELDAEATSKDFLIVRPEGRRKVRRKVKHYSLDAIISIGYRVNSKRAVRFRQWATRTLREHLVSGYTLNKQRLAEPALTRPGKPWGCSRARSGTRHSWTRPAVPCCTSSRRMPTQEGIEHRPGRGESTALTLLIAESAPSNKDLMIRLVVNLIGEFDN